MGHDASWLFCSMHAVNKIFIEPPSPEPKVMIPMYEPLKTETCKKCDKIVAEPKKILEFNENRFLKNKINSLSDKTIFLLGDKSTATNQKPRRVYLYWLISPPKSL